MKTLGLLLIWSISWHPAGIHDRSPSSSRDLRSGHPVIVAALDRPTAPLPTGRPSGDRLGALLWDAEDSSDGDPGDVLDTGLSLHSPGPSDQAALAWFAIGRGGTVWTSCQRLPLRC